MDYESDYENAALTCMYTAHCQANVKYKTVEPTVG